MNRILQMAALAVLAAGCADDEAKIHVMSQWVRPTPPTQTMTAAYVMIHNNGTSSDALTGASTEAAEAVEIHNMTMDGDVMKMRKVDRIEIAPGGAVTLEPGGYHLMLIGLRKPLMEGDTVTLDLAFEKAGTVTLDAPVRKGGGHDDHSGHSH